MAEAPPKIAAGATTRAGRHRLFWRAFDAFALLAILGGVYLLWRAVSRDLGYHWDWSAIPPLIWRPEKGELGVVGQGFLTTLRLAFFAAILAALIGAAVAILRLANDRFANLCGWAYVALIRNTPPLVFLFVFYFFVSSQLIGPFEIGQMARESEGATRAVVTFLFGEPRLIEQFVVGCLCLAMFEAAYVAEILRAGYRSVPKGQSEAARALGLSEYDRITKIVGPQALKNVAPPLASQFVSLIKDSALLSVIAIQDLTYMANQAALTSRRHFEIWITIGVLYFILCYGCSRLFKKLER